MKSQARTSWWRPATLAAGLALAATSCFAQMEKREANLYDASKFATAYPPIGSQAPELELTDLDGKPVRLSDFRGKTVVLIKGGYT
jgi:hypothetical protein